MEVQRSWSAPGLLILAAAVPWVASIRGGEFDVDQAHRASAFTNASVGFISWDNLDRDISKSADFEQVGYLGKVSSSYAWKATTIMDFGQDTIGMGPMMTQLPCVIKVPCQEVWDGVGEHTTKELRFRGWEPPYSELWADELGQDSSNQEESLAHAQWRQAQDLLFWAENDCLMANYLHQAGLPVVQCLYSSKLVAESINKKNIMFNVFEDYAPATSAWDKFVLGKSHKQIAEAFYSVMNYSLDAVGKLHKQGVEKIHHYLTLDSIALQFSQHEGEDGQQVSVKLTNFERMTSAGYGSEPTLEHYLTALSSGTWDHYLGSPPEAEATQVHAQNPRAFDVFMLGCALLHMMTGAAPQDMLFQLKQEITRITKKAPGGEHQPRVFNKDEWDPRSIVQAFHIWLESHSTAANGEVKPESLIKAVNSFIRVTPDTYSTQPWYPVVAGSFAPELPNVREAIAPRTGAVYNFNTGVVNIIAKMMSFDPGARPSIEDIISKEMVPLQDLLHKIT